MFGANPFRRVSNLWGQITLFALRLCLSKEFRVERSGRGRIGPAPSVAYKRAPIPVRGCMRRWLWIAAVLLLIVAGDAAVWMFATRRLAAGLSDWVAAQRAAGWQISAQDQRAGGWPFAAALYLRHVAVDHGPPFAGGGIAWQSDRVILRIAALRPTTLQIDASGVGRVRVAGGPDLPYSAGRLVVAVPLQATRQPASAAMFAKALTAGSPGRTVTVHDLTTHVRMAPEAIAGEPAVSISLNASGITLPAGPDWPLGQRIASLATDAVLGGPLPAKGALNERAITWRNDGGVLHVNALRAVWGPLQLRAKAELQLDPDLQPTGTGSATMIGYTATANALATRGIMTQGAAIAAKALLSLMAHTPADGGPSEVEVPLSLQHRTLSMRQVPLVRLPALDWPAQ